MEDLLKQIGKNSTQNIIPNYSKLGLPSFNTRLNPMLQLDKEKEYEIAIVNLETYYSFPNIDETNNVFVHSHDNSWVKKFPREVMKWMT